MKLMKIITIIAIIIFISLTNKALLPVSNEIDNMEILKLVGLDYNKEEDDTRASLSFMMEKEEGGIGSEGETKKEYQEIMTYKSTSFNEAVRQMQFYTDKNVAGSHVKYFLIGEETAKNNINNAIEKLAKDQEVRLSSHVYLVKGMTAQKFLEEMVSSEYKLTEKLISMEEKSSEKTITKELTLSELLSSKLSKSGTYLIPTLTVNSSEELIEIKGGEEEQDESMKKRFDFYGYGIMKDNKLLSYINQDEAIIYNMLINKAEGGNIDIETKSGDIISFGINDIETSYTFNFSKDKLKQINIKIEFRSNFEEVQTEQDITKQNNMDEYEKLQEEKIKKQAKVLMVNRRN